MWTLVTASSMLLSILTGNSACRLLGWNPPDVFEGGMDTVGIGNDIEVKYPRVQSMADALEFLDGLTSPPVLQFLGSYQHTVIAYTVTSRPLQPAKRRDWLVSFPDVFLRSVRKYLFRKGAHRCNHWWGFNTVKVHNVSRILDNSNDSIADVVDKLQDPIILPFILNFVSGQFRNRCKSWINSRIDLFRIWLPISKNLAKTELSLERAGLLLKEGSQGRCGCSQWRGNSEGLRRSLYYSPKFHFNVLKTRRSGWK